MTNISLVSSSYSAPGVYLSQNTDGNTSSVINSFTAAYLFGEISESVSSSLTTGIPYNVPLLITSFEDFQIRLGNGNINNFFAPTIGPALTTYNSVKQFFRNAASVAGASLYFIRVRPVDSYDIVIGTTPDVFNITDDAGLAQTIYGYPIEINGVQLGRVDYDNEGNATHIGVVVTPQTSAVEAKNLIVSAIKNSSLNSSIYINNEKSSSNGTFTIYSRQLDNPIIINDVNTDTLIVRGYNGAVIFNSFTIFKSELDVYNPNFESIVNATDYVYSIETAIDPSVFPPGFLLAPAAFSKFNPQDRLIVGTALENKASEIDFSWMAVIDCGPQDGNDIVRHYGYERLNLGDFSSINSSDVNNGERPIYIAETQEFYLYNTDTNYHDGLNLSAILVETSNIRASKTFIPTVVPVVGQELTAGSVYEANYGNLYVVNRTFTPTLVPIVELDPVGDGSIMSGYVRKINMVYNIIQPSDITVAVANTPLQVGSYIRGNQLVGGQPGFQTYYRVQATFTPTVVPIDVNNPRGTGTPEPGLLSPQEHWVAKGQLVNNNGTLYYARQAFPSQVIGQSPSGNVVDRDIPLAFFKEWVRVNLEANTIKLATFTPSDVNSVKLGARNVLYNNASHEGFQREHLMYNAPLGHLAYYAPYVVDLEGYNVPPSSSVVGMALRSYSERGFFEPPAGVNYPLRGVLRPQINLTRAHQQQSNPTGMNAIRLLPNQGTVVYGARTRSANKLFRWINTRIIVNVVINSLRNSFDDKVFRAIDGQQTMFRQIRSTCEGILFRLWSGGGLAGTNPQDAYKVICNDTNNPGYSLEDGQVNVSVFCVPVSTLEILSITITRSAIGSLSATISDTNNI